MQDLWVSNNDLTGTIPENWQLPSSLKVGVLLPVADVCCPAWKPQFQGM